MKKILIGLASLFFLVIAPKQLVAATHPQLSLTDAIYADLAVRNYLDNVSIYYDGGGKDITKLNETRHWIPASTVKTFAAMYAYKLITEGKIHLYDMVTIDAKNDVPTELVTNELPTLTTGENVTVDRLLRQMITQSDNTAFNQLLDELGRKNINDYISSLGLTHSHVGSKLDLDTSQEQYEFDTPDYGINTTTAQDYAKAFMLIKKNKIPGAKNLLAILKQQKINNMIPLFLPKTIICAHKTGDLDPLFHDGGICQDKKRSYVLTIFTNAGDPNLVAHLSQLVYTKDYNLVGAAIPQPITALPAKNPPIDPLVMAPISPHILGDSTLNFLVPEITAADLGVTANDLSLTINNTDLPPILVPADSSLHALSDIWQLGKIIIAPGSQGRIMANLEIAKLRISEVRDLIKRGKTQEAQDLTQQLQEGLTKVAKDPSLAGDSDAQNAIEAISETRFALLRDELHTVSGDNKLALIKSISTQAQETIQNIQPNIPDAINATNPTQKPLIGQIVDKTDTSITIHTAGGQEIVVPTNSNFISIKNKQSLPPVTVTPTPEQLITISPNENQKPHSTHDLLTVGTTVALIGSTKNNTFSPSLILTNIPREIAAPEPVKVAKVDTKHNTMVVIENGIYAQINVNQHTIIKASDTTIPLNEIHTGDIVVVHGEPLKKTEEPTSTHLTPTFSTPTRIPTEGTKHSTNSSNESVKDTNPTPAIIQSTSIQVIETKTSQAITPTPIPQQNPTQSPQPTPTPTPKPTDSDRKKDK